jgi:hypothetical protein
MELERLSTIVEETGGTAQRDFMAQISSQLIDSK